MNSLIAARIAILAFAALFYMAAGMQIEAEKNTEATLPFGIAVVCTIVVWFIQ